MYACESDTLVFARVAGPETLTPDELLALFGASGVYPPSADAIADDIAFGWIFHDGSSWVILTPVDDYE